MTPQASIIENVVYRAVHLVEKSGQAINPLVPKMTNKGIVAAGKILSKVFVIAFNVQSGWRYWWRAV